MERKKTIPEGTTTESKTRKARECLDIEGITKMIGEIKTKSPENSRILSERLARFLDATNEKNEARASLRSAYFFIKG